MREDKKSLCRVLGVVETIGLHTGHSSKDSTFQYKVTAPDDKDSIKTICCCNTESQFRSGKGRKRCSPGTYTIDITTTTTTTITTITTTTTTTTSTTATTATLTTRGRTIDFAETVTRGGSATTVYITWIRRTTYRHQHTQTHINSYTHSDTHAHILRPVEKHPYRHTQRFAAQRETGT